jgi:hypothetical protein
MQRCRLLVGRGRRRAAGQKVMQMQRDVSPQPRLLTGGEFSGDGSALLAATQHGLCAAAVGGGTVSAKPNARFHQPAPLIATVDVGQFDTWGEQRRERTALHCTAPHRTPALGLVAHNIPLCRPLAHCSSSTTTTTTTTTTTSHKAAGPRPSSKHSTTSVRHLSARNALYTIELLPSLLAVVPSPNPPKHNHALETPVASALESLQRLCRARCTASQTGRRRSTVRQAIETTSPDKRPPRHFKPRPPPRAHTTAASR